jgi:hypothetical protein
MYQSLPPFTGMDILMTSILIIAGLGAVLVYVGNEGKYNTTLLSGWGLLILIPFIFGIGFPYTQTQQLSYQTMMEQNIMKKYNTLYGDGYFEKVEFAYSAESKASKWSHSNYFYITYGDLTTETRRFEFDRTGEPSCSCKLKH